MIDHNNHISAVNIIIMPPRLWIPPSSTATPALKHLTDSTRRKEALSLYREILRTAKHFHWADEKSGRPWNQLLREQARQEFQASRQETDPLIIARMIVTGRDCVQQIQNKFNAATTAAWNRIATDSSRTAGASTSSSSSSSIRDSTNDHSKNDPAVRRW